MNKIKLGLSIAIFMSASVFAADNNLSAFQTLLPQYVSWAENIETQGVKNGVPLNKENLKLAEAIGI